MSASSHTGADDKVNTVGEYVDAQAKAWTCANYNSVSMNIELCGFASWSTEEWHRHPNMLENCAKWIAEEAAHYGIPITRLSPGQAQSAGRGVCQHVDLGSMGGGHHDCGSGFPMDYVLTMAHAGGAPYPTPPEDTMAIAATQNADGRIAVFVHLEDGSVKHCEQERPNGDWWKKADGTYEWLSLGKPGK